MKKILFFWLLVMAFSFSSNVMPISSMDECVNGDVVVLESGLGCIISDVDIILKYPSAKENLYEKSKLDGIEDITGKEIYTEITHNASFHYYLIKTKNGTTPKPDLKAKGFEMHSWDIYEIESKTGFEKTDEEKKESWKRADIKKGSLRGDGKEYILVIEAEQWATGSFNADVSVCDATLSSDDTTYYLTANLSCEGTGVSITGDNVIFDCQGNNMTSDDTGYGVFENGENTIIKNCIIKNFSEGIRTYGTNATLDNTTIYFSSVGIYFIGIKPTLINSNIFNTSSYLLYLKGNEALIENNTFSNCTNSPSVYALRAQHAIVRNNTFTNMVSIYWRGTHSGLITNNTMTNLSGYSFYAYAATADYSYNNTFANNTITTDKGGYGIIIISGENNTIEYNNIFGDNTNGRRGIDATTEGQTDNTIIRHNVFRDWGDYTIIVGDNTRGHVIYNNTINTSSASSDYAIVASPANDTNISNNNITTNNTGRGIYVTCDNCTIHNNTINNTVDYVYIIELSQTNNSIVSNNDLTSSGDGKGLLLQGDNLTVRHNTLDVEKTYGIIASDPTTNSLFEYNYVTIGDDLGYSQTGGENNTIQYNNFTCADQRAVYIYDSANATNITNNNITSTTDIRSIYLSETTEIRVGNNTITSVANNVIELANADDSNIINNTINTSGGNVILIDASSTGNNIYHNNITGTSWISDSGSSNYFNTTDEGNIYYYYNGTASWDVYDITTTSYPAGDWADGGTDRPFSNSTLGEWLGEGNDSHPWTEKGVFPENATIDLITNATMGHWFYVNASVDDANGGTDISTSRAILDNGSFSEVFNSTSANNFNIQFNCSTDTEQTTNITVEFVDSEGNGINTSPSTNTYPDNAPSLTQPTIAPNPAYTNSTLTCNAGTFSDVDGDVENESSRTWAWYKNGAIIGGENSATLSSSNFQKDDNISCEENVSAQNWSAIATNMSDNLTISNLGPVNASSITFSNCSVGHCFNASASVDDADGASDIDFSSISVDNGSCVYLTNSTSENTLNITYNCSDANLTTNATITFNDTSDAQVSTASSQNTYPNHAPSTGSPNITPTPADPYSNLTCNAGAFTDPDDDSEGAHAWRWFKNDSIIGGETSQTLDSSNFDGHDKIICEQTPRDNYSLSGDPANSSEITIRHIGTNLSVYNGSAWIKFSDSNYMLFLCDGNASLPSYCQADNQDNTTSQPILTNINNGTATSLWQAIKANTSLANADLICGTSTNPANGIIVNESYQNYSTSNITAGANNTIYCWLNVTNTSVTPLIGNLSIQNNG